MSQRKAILTDVGTYAASTYAAQMIDMVNGFLVRRLLGPSMMGLWVFLQVIVTYSKYTLLGVVQVANKEIPYLKGKGEHEKAEALKNNIYGFTVITGVINALLCIAYGLWKHQALSLEFLLGLIASAVIVYSQRIYNYSVVILRVTKQFNLVAKLMIFSSAVTLLLTLTLTLSFGFYGFLVSQVVIYWINTWFINRCHPLKFKFSLDSEKLKPVVKLGLSLILCQVAYTVLTSLDRILIAKMAGFKELGLFSVALMANTYVVSFPNLIGIVLFPYYQEKFGERDNIQDLKIYVLYPTTSLTYLLPFMLGVVWFTSPILVHYVIPEYTGGLTALQVLLLGSYFLCMTQHFNIFLITINRQFSLFFATLAAILLAVFLMVTSLRTGRGIAGVAFSELVVYALYLYSLMALSLKHVGEKNTLFWAALKVFLVFVYMAGGFYGIEQLFGNMGNETPPLISSLVKLLAALIYLSPLLYFSEKETQVVSQGWAILKERFKGHAPA